MSAGAPSAGEIGARIDRLPPSRTIWRAILLLSFGMFFELYDLLFSGYIAPSLVKTGLLTPTTPGLFGTTGVAGFIAALFTGLFIGTILCGFLADIFGRRTIFTASLIWYALATLGMATSATALQLHLWRLVSGVGIGVELVTIDAYVSEIAPARLRGRAFALNQAIQFTAVPIVAFACWRLLPLTPLGVAGWRWVMLLGASGAVAVWFIRARLPESPRWLERQGRIAEAEQIVRSLEAGGTRRPEPEPPPAVPPPAPPSDRGALREAFSPRYRRRTLMLVVFNIAQAIGFYGFGNWAPSLIAARGHSVTHSLGYSFAIAAAYPIGPLLCLAIADRLERKTQIMIAAIGTAVLGLTFATQSQPLALIALGVGVTLSNNLLSYAYHAYQAELYPTRIRSAAVGFVYAWSRLATVFSSFIIAALLGAFGAPGVFAFIAAAMAVVVLSVGLLGPRTSGRSLEALSE